MSFKEMGVWYGKAGGIFDYNVEEKLSFRLDLTFGVLDLRKVQLKKFYRDTLVLDIKKNLRQKLTL